MGTPTPVADEGPTRHETLSVDDPALFIDRDLSFLRFQYRVLEEARDAAHPLLDRVKFAAIVGTNIDDFLVSRGAALATRETKAVLVEHVLTAVLRDTFLYWRRRLQPLLTAAGIEIVTPADLSADETRRARTRLLGTVRTRLSPVPWPPSGTLPTPNMGLSFVVSDTARGVPRYLIRVPDDVPALVQVDGTLSNASHEGAPLRRRFVWVADLIRAHLPDVCPDVAGPVAHAFRVLRDASLPLPPDGEPWSARHVLQHVPQAGTHPVVAVIAERRMPAQVLGALASALDIDTSRIRRTREVFDFRRLWDVHRVPRPDLRSTERPPRRPARLRDHTDIFAAIRAGDILLHHPADDFAPVIDLVRDAAADPSVTEIAMSLYRTERPSALVAALCDAARRSARVRVLVELGARFDEERNARASVTLAEAGAEVFHAPRGVKVHAKMLVVTRHEGQTLRRYAHISSGNYNAFTARTYTDVALLTCDEGITRDVQCLLDALAGRVGLAPLTHILSAPTSLRANLLALIEREIRHTQRGRGGRIVLKMNALVDREVILALYRASQQGVQVDLLVRGSCCVRPRVPGLSDHIRVRSIVGRYLEHSRIWIFGNGGQDDVFIGSADVMPRNLDRRVEVMVPVRDAALRREVQSWIETYLADNTKARELGPDGVYARCARPVGEPPLEAQAVLFA